MLFTEEVKTYAKFLGADLVGVADLARVKGIETVPEGLLDKFTHAVVIAFQVSPEVFGQIDRQPTPLYAQQYSAKSAA